MKRLILAGNLTMTIAHSELEPIIEQHLYPQLANTLHRSIKSMVGISAIVEVKAPDQIPRSEGKAQRVSDLRQRYTH